MAGIRSAADELDVVEVAEPFPHLELLSYEALGLCGRGEAADFALSGATARDGAIPVNPSGGVIGEGNPINVASLRRAAWLTQELRGTAGDCQVDSAGRGVVIAAEVAPYPWAVAAALTSEKEA
jgi:acetyl-CoA acetyltransferase